MTVQHRYVQSAVILPGIAHLEVAQVEALGSSIDGAETQIADALGALSRVVQQNGFTDADLADAERTHQHLVTALTALQAAKDAFPYLDLPS